MLRTVNQFDFYVTALGEPSGSYRLTQPDVPMLSPGATEALYAAVDEIKRVLAERGFIVTHTGYGVRGQAEVEFDA